jgi:hypothetical protein
MISIAGYAIWDCIIFNSKEYKLLLERGQISNLLPTHRWL